jgi:hypothetical protein
MGCLKSGARSLTKSAAEFQMAVEAFRLSAAEAAEPPSPAEPRRQRVVQNLARAKHQIDRLTRSLKIKMKKPGRPAMAKKERKKARDELREADFESTSSASASAALASSEATGAMRRTPASRGATRKRGWIPSVIVPQAAPTVRSLLSVVPVAAAPAAAAPASRLAAVPAAAVAAVPSVMVAEAAASPVAAVPAGVEAAVLAALAEALGQAVPTSGARFRRTAHGTFRIAEGLNKTFIAHRPSDIEKERHVVFVLPSMTKFHNRLGWELFKKLVAGDIDKAQAKELRSRLLAELDRQNRVT